MSGIDTKADKKQEQLKQIIRDLQAGVAVKKLKKQYAELIRKTAPEEIAAMETALIKEGFPAEEIQRLCDVHAAVFDDALQKVKKASKIPGHPIHTYLEENRAAEERIGKLLKLAKKLRHSADQPERVQRFVSAFEDFTALEKHFQRKENQLFPALEKKQFTGPTQVMWDKHDEIREMLKEARERLTAGDFKQLEKLVKSISGALNKLIFLEEKILYPTARKKLTEAEWVIMKRGEAEIGYAWVTPGSVWDSELVANRQADQSSQPPQTAPSAEGQVLDLSTGRLTPEQVNLMLKRLPVDLTFVDELDQVRYYSDTPERIFPRSPGIIGRAVQNCHPPKSVKIVEKILKSFRDNRQSSADFWIKMDERLIYIRYFPMVDEAGNYKGTLEVSQDVTPIRKLKGERRLLDW